MANIPLFRSIIFSLIILFSLPVLGICAYIVFELPVLDDVDTIFLSLGLSAAGLSVASLPLFLYLGSMRTRVFTSRVRFEIIWFLLLWLLWAGSAGSTTVASTLVSPWSPTDSLIIPIETFAYLNAICTFIYYVTIFWYAIINAARGRRIWSASVKDAANVATPGVVVPMTKPPYATQYGSYPPNVPSNQPYNSYFQQVPAQAPLAQPYNSYSQIPGQVPPAQPYNTYPQPLAILPQGAYNQQYNAYPSHVSPQGAQNQYYSYPAALGAPRQLAGFTGQNTSMAGDHTTPPPQPNYNTYPVHDSQAPGTLPNASRR